MKVDELWHALILDTIVYHDLQDALQLSLHHRPAGGNAEESEDRKKRLAVMKAIYKIYFSTEPLEARPAPRPPSPPRSLGTSRFLF